MRRFSALYLQESIEISIAFLKSSLMGSISTRFSARIDMEWIIIYSWLSTQLYSGYLQRNQELFIFWIKNESSGSNPTVQHTPFLIFLSNWLIGGVVEFLVNQGPTVILFQKVRRLDYLGGERCRLQDDFAQPLVLQSQHARVLCEQFHFHGRQRVGCCEISLRIPPATLVSDITGRTIVSITDSGGS